MTGSCLLLQPTFLCPLPPSSNPSDIDELLSFCPFCAVFYLGTFSHLCLFFPYSSSCLVGYKQFHFFKYHYVLPFPSKRLLASFLGMFSVNFYYSPSQCVKITCVFSCIRFLTQGSSQYVFICLNSSKDKHTEP